MGGNKSQLFAFSSVSCHAPLAFFCFFPSKPNDLVTSARPGGADRNLEYCACLITFRRKEKEASRIMKEGAEESEEYITIPSLLKEVLLFCSPGWRMPISRHTCTLVTPCLCVCLHLVECFSRHGYLGTVLF